MTEHETIPETKKSTHEVLAKVNGELDKRGISIVEIVEEEVINTELLNLSSEGARKNIEQVMIDLNIPLDTKTTIKRKTVKFREDHSRGFLPDEYNERPEDQEMTIYTIHPQEKDPQHDSPIMVYAPGGSVRPRNTLQSSYTSLLQAQAEASGNSAFFYTMDYRGSRSDEENQHYCMEDRRTDALILTKIALEGHKKDFNINTSGRNKLALIGNSMGGDVAANISPIVNPDTLILLQPAAYPMGSDTSHFGGPGDRKDPENNPFGVAIRKPRMWKTANAYEKLEEYLRNGGNVYIVGGKEDTITGEQSKGYMKEVTYEYMMRALKVGELNTYEAGFLWIPTSHIETTKDEVKRVIDRSS